MNETNLLKMLADRVAARLDKAYTLVYLGQGDELEPRAVSGIISNDDSAWEDLYESTQEWESEQLFQSSCDVVDDLAEEIVDGWVRDGKERGDKESLLENWRLSDERDEVREMVAERDDSNWIAQLASRHGKVLLRIPLGIDLILGEQSSADLLAEVGLPESPENIALAQELILEAPTQVDNDELDVDPTAIGEVFALASIGLDEILAVNNQERVGLINPYLVLVLGDWMGTVGPFVGTLALNRSTLVGDGDAPGTPLAEYADVLPDDFPVKIEALPSRAEVDEAIASITATTTVPTTTTEEVAA